MKFLKNIRLIFVNLAYKRNKQKISHVTTINQKGLFNILASSKLLNVYQYFFEVIHHVFAIFSALLPQTYWLINIFNAIKQIVYSKYIHIFFLFWIIFIKFRFLSKKDKTTICKYVSFCFYAYRKTFEKKSEVKIK